MLREPLLELADATVVKGTTRVLDGQIGRAHV